MWTSILSQRASIIATFLSLVFLSTAGPLPSIAPRDVSGYAPISTQCPPEPLIRPATSLHPDETQYIASRKTKADTGLTAWLQKYGNFSTSQLPTVSLASSGGGLRTFFTTAGVVQAFDNRDRTDSTSGLYQGLTYHSALSGGAWFLTSMIGNSWPTVSSLQTNLWSEAFADSFLVPENLLSGKGATEFPQVVKDVAAKQSAGFQTSIVDPYGRLLSYAIFNDLGGAVVNTLSGLNKVWSLVDAEVPFPIITALGDTVAGGAKFPDLSAVQYEFTPVEYGSWDAGVASFANVTYMGTKMSNGKPAGNGTCVKNYDNLSYILSTSSDIFNGDSPRSTGSNDTTNAAAQELEKIVTANHPPTAADIYGLYPNPFYQLPQAASVADQPMLTMFDGGESNQNNPIWPFIAGQRQTDILIVNDNSADTDDNFPDGTDMYQTYVAAKAAGHDRMPAIPSPASFVAQGLNKQAAFFGCNQTDKMFIVYLPNVNYTFASNTPTAKVQYTAAESTAMIDNGNLIATQNGDKDWAFCLACAIKNKDGKSLPRKCGACFSRYCH